MEILVVKCSVCPAKHNSSKGIPLCLDVHMYIYTHMYIQTHTSTQTHTCIQNYTYRHMRT